MSVIGGGTLTQSAFQFYNDDAGANAATAWRAAAKNANVVAPVGQNIRYRVNLAGGGCAASSVNPQLMYSLNGGAYTAVSGSSSVVRSFDSPNVADNAATTERLNEPNTFVAGKFDDGDGTFNAAVSISCASDSEFEWCVQVMRNDVNDKDTIDLRAYKGVSTPMNGYTQTGRITVVKSSGFFRLLSA